MKKKIVAFTLSLMMALSMTACGSGSGVSQEEYDKVVKERDEYKARLDELTGNPGASEETQKEEAKENEFKIGETWAVDGKFKLTVTSVVETADRNQFDESNPAAVYVITYTYENLGISEDLYISLEDKIVDCGGKMGTSYPGNIEKYPQAVPSGAFCEAQACIAVENKGSFKNYVSLYDDEFNEYKAVFNLEIQ